MENQAADPPGGPQWRLTDVLSADDNSDQLVSDVSSTSLFLQELILPLLLLFLLILISALNPHNYYGGIDTTELESTSPFFKGLGYTPITNITNHIMEEVAQALRMFFETVSRHCMAGFH